jgi:tetratricopeptide (TPR) repeat protein
VVAALVLTRAVPALADDAKKDKAGDKKAKNEVQKDPDGVRGISPFWEAVEKGDNAYLARDFDGAIASYREAIGADPKNALGHYRIGEAQLAKGDLKEAELAWAAALRFVGENAPLKAKIFFVLADLKERQKAYDDATSAWTSYGSHVSEHAEAKGFPATAGERKTRIETWKKMTQQYAEVRTRIEKRLKEADEAARKSAR